jgi:AcrR family transcriptional regulator
MTRGVPVASSYSRAVRERLRPRRKPSQERSAVTHSAILTATRRVLIEEGYDGLTTTRVAKVAGVSVGTLYQYFPTKDALLATVVDEFLDGMRATILEGISMPSSTLAEAVPRVVDALLAAKAREGELNAVLLNQLPRVDGADRVDEFNRQLEPMVAAYLAQFPDELRWAPDELELVAFVLVHAVQNVLGQALRTRRELGAALARQLSALILSYLER